ncbi:hypothetical protein LTS10_002847 [Elasticomyces elasticus]|nr:hypothetical protein LTS10_002847 [Elasticomyces elasticus]
MHSLLFLALAISSETLATAWPGGHRRQATTDAEHDIEDVNAARYALSVIQAGNATSTCGQPDPSSSWNGSAYSSALAEQLITDYASSCEVAIGIDVFSDVAAAMTNLDLVFAALQSLQQTQSSNVGAQTCASFDPSTLNEAGLDGEAIRALICSTITASSASPSFVSTSLVLSASSTPAVSTSPESTLLPSSGIIPSQATTIPATSTASIGSAIPPSSQPPTSSLLSQGRPTSNLASDSSSLDAAPTIPILPTSVDVTSRFLTLTTSSEGGLPTAQTPGSSAPDSTPVTSTSLPLVAFSTFSVSVPTSVSAASTTPSPTLSSTAETQTSAISTASSVNLSFTTETSSSTALSSTVANSSSLPTAAFSTFSVSMPSFATLSSTVMAPQGSTLSLMVPSGVLASSSASIESASTSANVTSQTEPSTLSAIPHSTPLPPTSASAASPSISLNITSAPSLTPSAISNDTTTSSSTPIFSSSSSDPQTNKNNSFSSTTQSPALTMATAVNSALPDPTVSILSKATVLETASTQASSTQSTPAPIVQETITVFQTVWLVASTPPEPPIVTVTVYQTVWVDAPAPALATSTDQPSLGNAEQASTLAGALISSTLTQLVRFTISSSTPVSIVQTLTTLGTFS